MMPVITRQMAMYRVTEWLQEDAWEITTNTRYIEMSQTQNPKEPLDFTNFTAILVAIRVAVGLKIFSLNWA
ncbi:MAG: hypothetical protein CSB47_08460 [Proteobacteria bacterium]|nr:MAG: hypothetical protein CSB47_08460 [Pseudomonadota bacterium]